MKRPLIWVVLANLVVLIALVFIYPDLMVSPGPMSTGHTDLVTDCFACHAPLRGSQPARCVSCHEPADIGLRTTRGAPIATRGIKTSFHQKLIEQDCMACHSEHEGTHNGGRRFSHALLQADFRPRCASCHAKPADSLHRGIADNCLQCHNTDRWKPADFDHDKYFVLDRDHKTECVTCHEKNDFSRYTCFGCHEHRPAKIREEHLEEGIRNFENCVKCHRDPGVEPEND